MPSYLFANSSNKQVLRLAQKMGHGWRACNNLFMKHSAGNALGIYVSIPFCRSKCTYCNFASGVFPASDHARYVERVIEDLTGAGAWAGKMGVELTRRVDTVYLGGGTPSLLAPGLLARLFATMRAEFDFDADAEITMECAPGQIAGCNPRRDGGRGREPREPGRAVLYR